MDDKLKSQLIDFLEDMHSAAMDDFDSWNPREDKAPVLVSKLQDITYFLQELKGGKYVYDHLYHPYDPSQIKWLATNKNGDVVGFAKKPDIVEDIRWSTGYVFTAYHQRHIKPFKGDWRESLEKIA